MEPRSATEKHPLCRKEKLRNPLCRQFAARLVGAVNVRIGWFRPTRLKPFSWFRVLRRLARRSHSASSRMLHKCLSGRRISRARELHALPCGSSASSRRLFRFVGALRGRELPSVRRNAPEVCRKTRRFTLSSAPHFGPSTLSPSIDVQFRALDDVAETEICRSIHHHLHPVPHLHLRMRLQPVQHPKPLRRPVYAHHAV
jgi:hypothetical protein